MENKDIIFDGVQNVPDDSLAEDGQLSLSVNAIKHNGSIVPIEKGTPVKYDNEEDIAIAKNERLEYVHHLPDTGEERFIVLSTDILVQNIRTSLTEMTLNIGEEHDLNAYITPNDATNKAVTWASDDEGVASVDQDGNVTANRVGECNITATSQDGSEKSATCKVTVVKPVTMVELQRLLTLALGSTYPLMPTITPDDATSKELVWHSNHDDIVSVDENGVITGVSEGVAVITARPVIGNATAECAVTVAEQEIYITLNKSKMVVIPGATDTLSVSVHSNVGVVPVPSFSSSDTSIATVTSGSDAYTATITGVSSGTCTITVTAGNVTAECEVVVAKRATNISLSKGYLEIVEGDTETLSVTITPSDATIKRVTWSSNDPSVATVDGNGKVTAISRGSCEITATATDGSNKSDVCVVDVVEPNWVDLGLPSKTLWATKNVGASSSEESGDYFAWGETESKEFYSWQNYALCNQSYTKLNKYYSGDGLTELEPEDDAASGIVGRVWKMPNRLQIRELLDNTVSQWQDNYFGEKGVLLTSTINGKRIFLPAAGHMNADNVIHAGTHCEYWSRTLNGEDKTRADGLFFRNNALGLIDKDARADGLQVRPIFVGSAPSGRPGRDDDGRVNVTFTLMDELNKVELIGRLDEGRTMTLELTYEDEGTGDVISEIVSVRFTKEDTYILPTRQNNAERMLVGARLVGYDDSSVLLNITWIINAIGNITQGGEEEEQGSESTESAVEPIFIQTRYYYGSIGGYYLYPTEAVEQARQEAVQVFRRSISADGSALHICWFNKANGERKELASINSAIREITSVKNVLIISTDAGLYFARNTGQEYQWLGQLPELPCVTPYLETTIKADTQYPAKELSEDYFDTSGKTTYEYGKRYIPSSSDKAEIFTVLSAHHGQILDGIHKEGCFAFPFQVRIAYRMFDGTYISVSRPYPMCPSTTYLPLSLISIEPNEETKLHINVLMAASRLNMKINGYIDDAWKDIITGFDIFVSSEVEDYTADESGDSIEWIDTGDEFYNKEDVSRYIPYHFSVSANGNDLFKKDNYIDFEKGNDTEDTITKESVTMSANETITIDDDEYAYTETETRTVYAFKKSDIDNNKITINRSKWSDSLKSAGAVLTTESEDFTIEYMLLYDLLNKYFEIEEINASQYYFVPLKQSLLQYQIGNVTKVTSIKANEAINDAFKITINPTAINFFDYGSSNTDVISMGSSYFFYKDSYDYYDRLKKSKFFTVYVCTTDVSGNPFQVYLSASAYSVEFSGKQILQQGDLFYEHFREKYGSQIDNYTIVSSIISRPNSPVIPTMGIKAAYGNVTYSEYHIYIGYNINGTIVSNVDLDKTFCGFLKTRRTTGDSVEKAFRNQGEFWRIDSVNLEDIKGRTTYPVSISENDIEKLNKHDLETLSSQKMLDTSVVNRYAFNCSDLFTYNSRLNVVIDKQELETPDYADNLYMGVEKGEERQQIDIKYAVEVVKNGITRIVPVPQNQSDSTYDNALRYFFYPNKNATRLLELKNDTTIVQETFIIELDEIIVGGGLTQQPMGEGEKYVFNIDCSTHGSKINTYTLTQHEAIFGSYAFNDWDLLKPVSEMGITKELVIGEISAEDSSISQYIVLNKDEIFEKFKEQIENNPAFSTFLPRNFSVSDIGTTIEVPETQNDTTELAEKIQAGYNKEFHVGNKILQSDVENPFAFLNRGVVQLGCETIHRICATSRPISEGQKGKHPLYAFTDEGIYALAVNDEGEYMKADLVSPEVITSDDVHQVEQSVLFATSKGLMSISENDLVCLSAKIEGHNHAEGLIAMDAVKDALGLEYVGSIGFHAKDWFTTSELVYDAKNGLVYLFQEPMPDAYGWHEVNLGLVYDVAQGAWGMYENKMLYGVNSYTDALAVELTDRMGEGVLVNMSNPLNRHSQTYRSLILTRPMQLGKKDEYKTMEDIILRGAQGTNKGMLVVWASNDLEHWKVIGSSSSYKWRNYSGTPYKYFRLGVLMDGWAEGDSITGASVDITTRLTNKNR